IRESVLGGRDSRGAANAAAIVREQISGRVRGRAPLRKRGVLAERLDRPAIARAVREAINLELNAKRLGDQRQDGNAHGFLLNWSGQQASNPPSQLGRLLPRLEDSRELHLAVRATERPIGEAARSG